MTDTDDADDLADERASQARAYRRHQDADQPSLAERMGIDRTGGQGHGQRSTGNSPPPGGLAETHGGD